jgi:release factor glutamine methyltransferase
MTVRDTLSRGVSALRTASIETPLLDASVLLADSLGITREKLFADLPVVLSPFAERVFLSRIESRASGRPIAYLTGRKEFWSLNFSVDERVLIPRPDTEILVEGALAILDRDRSLKTAHDACTGSGCVAIALGSARPDVAVSASDVSPEALAVFGENCLSLLGRSLPGYESDLLAAVPGKFDVITANPPYVERREAELMAARGWPEPFLALDGGGDGLDLIRRLIPQAAARLNSGGWLLVESGSDQTGRVVEAMKSAGFTRPSVLTDLAGRNRVSVGRMSWTKRR